MKDGAIRARVYTDATSPSRKTALVFWEYYPLVKEWHPIFRTYRALRRWQNKNQRQAGNHLGGNAFEIAAEMEYTVHWKLSSATLSSAIDNIINTKRC